MVVIPHFGVGPVQFGMTRAEVAAAVSATPRRGRRSKYSVSDYDFFAKLQMFVNYDANDRASMVELGPASDLVYGGYHLFAHSARDVAAWAHERDPALTLDCGFRSDVLGLSMHAPLLAEQPDDIAQGFGVFRPGAFEEEMKRIQDAMKKPRE